MFISIELIPRTKTSSPALERMNVRETESEQDRKREREAKMQKRKKDREYD